MIEMLFKHMSAEQINLIFFQFTLTLTFTPNNVNMPTINVIVLEMDLACRKHMQHLKFEKTVK